MKFLASGSEKRVAIPIIAGVLILLISSFVDDVYGFATLIGIGLLLQGCLLVNAYRDPQRKIKFDQNLIYTPIDGTLEIIQKQVLVGYRPSKSNLVMKITLSIQSLETGLLMIPRIWISRLNFVAATDKRRC